MKIIRTKPHGPASTAALAELENQIGQRLPDDFRAFLLEHNGPVIDPLEFHVEDYIDSIDGELYGLHDWKEKDLREAYFHASQDWPSDLLPFADDGGGNYMCLGLSGARMGEIYFIDHELFEEGAPDAGVILLADGLFRFLDGLFEYDEED